MEVLPDPTVLMRISDDVYPDCRRPAASASAEWPVNIVTTKLILLFSFHQHLRVQTSCADKIFRDDTAIIDPSTPRVLPDFTFITSQHTFTVIVLGPTLAIHYPVIDSSLHPKSTKSMRTETSSENPNRPS